MQQFKLRDNKGRDYVFVGEEVAHVSTLRPQTGQERWTELKVFKTKGGNFVCQKLGKTQVPGEIEYSTIEEMMANVAESRIFKFFGASYICREVYEQLRLPYPSIVID